MMITPVILIWESPQPPPPWACYLLNVCFNFVISLVYAVTATGFCEIVFRLTNGQGVYQWVRGKARTLYDKNDKPESVTADNVLLK